MTVANYLRRPILMGESGNAALAGLRSNVGRESEDLLNAPDWLSDIAGCMVHILLCSGAKHIYLRLSAVPCAFKLQVEEAVWRWIPTRQMKPCGLCGLQNYPEQDC